MHRFLKTWIKEYLDLFGDIRFFHLGGDEAYVFTTCSHCSARTQKIGRNELYAEHLLKIASPILEKGVRPGIWGDMILKHPERLNMIPFEFVIRDWNYWDGDRTPSEVMVWGKDAKRRQAQIGDKEKQVFPEIIDQDGNLRAFYTAEALKRLGFDVILCSSTRSHGDAVFAERHDVHASNVIGAARKAADLGLLGTCLTSWAVHVHNYETQEPWLRLAPLVIQQAELSSRELLEKCSNDLFGVANTEFFEAIRLIGYPFPFADKKSTGIMWTSLKDARPTPPGYIQSLIEKWQTSDGGKQWRQNVRRVRAAPAEINTGISLLNAFTLKARKGFEVLRAWSMAGYPPALAYAHCQ